MQDIPPTGATSRQIIEAIRSLIKGYGNFVFTVTLNAGATTTTLTNQVINSNCAPSLTPMTANAAAAMATTYVSSIAPGVITLTHANNAQTDRTFKVAVKGG